MVQINTHSSEYPAVFTILNGYELFSPCQLRLPMGSFPPWVIMIPTIQSIYLSIIILPMYFRCFRFPNGYFKRHRLVGMGLLKVFWTRKTPKLIKGRRFLPNQVCGDPAQAVAQNYGGKKDFFHKIFLNILISDLFPCHVTGLG